MKIIRAIVSVFVLAAAFLHPVETEGKNFTVVLDPGHGGHDPGTHGKTAKEKTIALNVSNKVKSLLEKHKDINVLTTRDRDIYVTLDGRALKANKSLCDLFVSIHCNSLDEKNPRRLYYCGATVYSMSMARSTENLEIVKKENSVIELDKLYAPEEQRFASDELAILSELNQTNNIHHSVLAANLLQRELATTAGRHDLGTKKAGFLVLRKTTRPAVLVELDYLCNPKVEEFMNSESGQNKLAKALYNGIIAYKNSLDTDENITTPIATEENYTDKAAADKEPTVEKTETVSQSNDTGKEEFRIQFLTCSRQLKSGAKELKGVNQPDCYKEGGAIKYTYGHYPTQESALQDLKNIKKKFPDAFIIRWANGRRAK